MQYSCGPVIGLQELTRGYMYIVLNVKLAVFSQHHSESHYQDRTEKESVTKHSYLVQLYVRTWGHLGCQTCEQYVFFLEEVPFRTPIRSFFSFSFGTTMLDSPSTFIFLPSVSVMLTMNAFLLRVAWA
ncbi:hypothetical protein K0M31_000981 [Melipona bicolor]|uniref:Uncharacterized protein n=1 Tax=Melipona bicolor TaxID=60889 RepID=A0AA40GEU4_9HYME|nr:hypothetical protein K0M31_000981 [Melipona bicolor]